jgi:cullin 1
MKRLITECEDVLIRFHLPQFYEEFKKFLNKDRDEDMGNMFQLALRVEHGLLEMQRLMEEHVTKQGLDAITAVVDEALNEPRVYVQTLLKVYTKYKALVMTAFQNHPLFAEALDKACATFVNKNAVTEKANQARKSPELLARYCDFLLKKSSKVAEEDELEDILANIMIVFRYIDSKDVFQKFYSNMLAKRLVEHLSMSDDAEASMISKLKETCGALYTSKLQKMFQDVTVNVDLNTRFRQHVKQSGSALEFDFSVEVLTHGSWPFTQMPLFALPAELETCMDRFKLFYIHQHSGRKLIWLYHKSRAEIISNCFKRRYTMISSMYQVAVLLQYNHNTSYTLQQLQENTNINISDLQQVVRTLLKIRLLLCDNATSDDEVDLPLTAILDLYQDYSNKKLRININVALKSTEKKELEATHQNVDEERRHLIEAAVIRIMKTKKTLKHGELIIEVMKQLSTRFKAESKSIKKCIDGLIEREYLSRSAESANIYNYVA